MDDRLTRAIETDDAETLLDCLEDVYNTAFEENYQGNFSQENMHGAYNHIYSKLKSIADKHQIEPQRLTLIDEIKAKIEQIKTEFYQNKDYERLKLEYDKLWEISADYIAQFIKYAEELHSVFTNPELIDRKQELLDKWAEEDKNFPLETPRMVEQLDEDGWPIDGTEHLETEEEVNKRIEDTLKYRKNMLAKNEFGNSKELFIKWYQFICNIKELAELNQKLMENKNKTQVKIQEIKFEEFKSDTEFYDELLKIMEHDTDKEIYWYHGTQDIDSAYSIVEQGLGLARKELTTTAYNEFTPKQLLLYSRGWAGEIGSDAIVIFKQPKNEKGEYINIVNRNQEELNFTSSGLGGMQSKLDYIIPSEYMVGIVNKRDHKIIYANELTNNQTATL